MGHQRRQEDQPLRPQRASDGGGRLVTMALWDLLTALRRWWPVALAGAVLTAGLGIIATREPGLYFTRMEVVFLAPPAWYSNVLQGTTEEVIMTASAVAKRTVGAGSVIKYGSLEATIIGTTSSREGVWIRAEDQGGQWAPDLRAPIILVDVVAPNPERVRELQHESALKIRSALSDLQSQLKAGKRNLITIQVAPDATVIYRVRGDRLRALGMTSLLGGAVTLAVIRMLETRRRRTQSVIESV